MTNEARQAAYFNLIESLLNCPSGEKAAILKANLELVDAGLVEMMREMAAQQEDENAANWLETLAQQLAEVFNLTSEASLPLDEAGWEERLRFLMEVLQATINSRGNPEVIYPLLAANTDKIDDHFAEILRQWATATLAEAETDRATSIAAVIGEFSNLIKNFPLGSKASNMEIAVAGYQAVATVFTQDAFPQDWATVQDNLGNAYSDRILGEIADNFEQAIVAYAQALLVRTQDDFPQDWAMTQNNLGIAYSKRIVGDKADNLEKAIAAYTQALQVRTQDAFPQDWAMTQNNLGTAYRDRIKGDKADNLEKAIAAYTQALQVRTQDAFPQDWAMTKNNLGIAYSDRIKGDKADNLEKAIAAYTQALQVRTQDAFPQQWAMTKNNLGIAYSDRIKGDKADNLEKAIAAYTQALQVRTQDAFPQQWATTQNNFGTAYSKRIVGDKANNLEKAIAAYTAALTIRTQIAFPQDWATTQNNLGNAYSDRIKGDKADNLELAITAYTAALTIYTQTAFPQNYIETAFNLGLSYQKRRDLDLNAAYQTFTAAINTLETLRGEIISGEDSKRKQSEEWNKLYRGMVEVCLELEKETEAIEYVERSKTRTLVEALHKAKSEDAEIMTPIQYHEIQKLIDSETVIIEWYIFRDCFRAFIITHDRDEPRVWTSQREDLENLLDFVVDEYFKTYYTNKKLWQHQISLQLEQLAEIIHINDVLSLVPPSCRKLILIPHLYLHLLPLHALPLAYGECLLDKFSRGVSYAPSCQMLRYGKKNSQTGIQQADKNLLRNFFAIQNPSKDLDYSDIEVETIAAKFSPKQVLKHSQATKSALLSSANLENLRDSQWLHFSCHGSFNLESPLQSGLRLAGDDKIPNSEEYLTLEEIFKLNISNCRLVCLCACETGMVNLENSDEYLGLSSGFIRAGATSIVSSLWEVNDLSTAYLMIKFYEIIQSDADDIPLALNTAQKWLRDVHLKDFIAWIDGKEEIKLEQKQVIKYFLEKKYGKNYNPDAKPFCKPSNWAAFCAVAV